MQFGIKRLSGDAGQRQRYQLYDNAGLLILVAEPGSPQQQELRRHMQFARPDGQVVATLDAPRDDRAEDDGRSRGGRSRDYVIIADHAVYAIINAYRTSSEQEARDYFTVEVEGERLLLLAREDGAGGFALYGEIPEGLSIYNELSEADLPEPVGRIARDGTGYDFTIDLLPGQFRQMGLMALALAFLIDVAETAV